jgi:hypothetical protein
LQKTSKVVMAEILVETVDTAELWRPREEYVIEG